MPSLRLLLSALLICAVSAPRAPGDAPFANELLDELISSGIRIGEQKVPLSSPIADPRLSREDLANRQKRLAGPRDWDAFTRDSVVAPVQIDLSYLKDPAGNRIGLSAHFAFVVHVELSKLRDDDSLRAMLAKESDAEKQEDFLSEPIPQDVLARLGVRDADVSAYGWIETVLLNKVALQGVIRSERLSGPQSLEIAWNLDDRFTDRDPPDAKYRNEWQRLQRDDLGREERGDANSYSGAAGYLIVTELLGVEHASLIEAEILLHEPEAWFNGSNLLRSKVPLIIQESVRKLRRALR